MYTYFLLCVSPLRKMFSYFITTHSVLCTGCTCFPFGSELVRFPLGTNFILNRLGSLLAWLAFFYPVLIFDFGTITPQTVLRVPTFWLILLTPICRPRSVPTRGFLKTFVIFFRLRNKAATLRSLRSPTPLVASWNMFSFTWL
jgi:hypothetical protein